jgi:type II secretory pathway component PulM
MLENSVIQITTGKLVAATLVPNSILLITGIVIWRFWRNKQTQLQSKADELSDEVKQIKEQMTDMQIAQSQSPSNTVSPSSSKETENTSSEKSGLFKFLIEDNIQLRKQA